MVSFPQASPPELCTALPSPIHATCTAHLILLNFTTRTILGKEYRSLSSSLCNFLHSPVTSSLLGPNNLNTLFSDTLSLRSSFPTRQKVLHICFCVILCKNPTNALTCVQTTLFTLLHSYMFHHLYGLLHHFIHPANNVSFF